MNMGATEMGAIPEYSRGFQDGVRQAIAWLHYRAGTMRDPHAVQILNGAATNLGWEKLPEKRARADRSEVARLRAERYAAIARAREEERDKAEAEIDRLEAELANARSAVMSITRARAEERVRACRRICKYCASGDTPVVWPDTNDYWHTGGPLHAADGMQPCAAAAIRRSGDECQAELLISGDPDRKRWSCPKCGPNIAGPCVSARRSGDE